MFTDYIPPGCATIPEAALMLARARHPENWSNAAVPEQEREIWRSIKTFARVPEFIEAYLRELQDREPDGLRFSRLLDYDDALQDLRIALGEGKLVVSVDGALLGERHHIISHSWRTSAGLDAILQGVTIESGEARRFFLRKEAVLKLLGRLSAERVRFLFSDWWLAESEVAHENESGSQTSADKQRACVVLARELQANPDLTRKQAQGLIKEAGLSVSNVGFKTGVWPTARIMAGLPEKARPGAKKGKRRPSP